MIMLNSNFHFERKLRKTLQSYGMLEDDERLRRNVIKDLDNIFQIWVKQRFREKGGSLTAAKAIEGKTFTVGSFQIGVYETDSDIDILCVAPYNIDENDYFDSFSKTLNSQKPVTDLRSIRAAVVPLIRLKYCNIEINLIFTNLPVSQVMDDLNLIEFYILDTNIQRKRILSTYYLLQFYPMKDTFKLALQFIRLWAKTKRIYSNILGFLGGVSWSLLLVHAYYIYRSSNAITLVEKFFELYADWPWPEPVWLPGETPRPEWVKTSQLMPIMTPVQNSSSNITRSTRTIIQNEIKEAHKTFKHFPDQWEKLVEPTSFFKYEDYIVITAKSGRDYMDQIKWAGFVESKLRLLIDMLDNHRFIELAHINTQKFTPLNLELGEHGTSWVIGLIFKRLENEKLDYSKINFDDCFDNFINRVKNYKKTNFRRAPKTVTRPKNLRLKFNFIKKEDFDKILTEKFIVNESCK